MYSHITLGTNDGAKAIPFYDAIMELLGHSRFHGDEDKGFGAWGQSDGDQVWVLPPFDGKAATIGNGMHVAFIAPDRATVRAVHAAALALGAQDEGAPGLRPHYHPHYYGAYFRDPDGNKLQVVCHNPENEAE